MAQQPIPERYSIERKESPQTQTEARRIMADVLEANWDSGKTLKDLADEAGYSRQHAANVLDSHFSMIERDETMIEKDEDTNEITVTIPDDVEPSSYLRGVSDALEKAQ